MCTEILQASGLTGYVDVFSPYVPREALLEILTERDERCKRIAKSLAGAFGGRGQYSPEDLGRAVAGHIRNNGLGCYGTAAELCCCVYEQSLFRGDDHFPPEEVDYDHWMPAAVAACESNCDASGCPHRHYVPPADGY